MSNIDILMFKILMLNGNETSTIEDPDVYHAYEKLVIALASVKYDIRYCTNESCSCHAEMIARKILEGNDDLKEFLEYWNVLEWVNKVLYEDYTGKDVKTIWDHLPEH